MARRPERKSTRRAVSAVALALVAVGAGACGGRPAAAGYKAACGQLSAGVRAEITAEATPTSPYGPAKLLLGYVREGAVDAHRTGDARFEQAFDGMATHLAQTTRSSTGQQRNLAAHRTELAAETVAGICAAHHEPLEKMATSLPAVAKPGS